MIIDALANFVTTVISHLGYPGVFLLMALESACIPIPSEFIMPFSGFLVTTGEFSLFWIILLGSIGNLVGSYLAYWVGYRGGRPLIEKYGKYVLLSHKDLDASDRYFKKYGDSTVLFTRLMPVIRTFISLPAGISKMDPIKFGIYTLIGVVPFTAALAYAGVVLKQNWAGLQPYFHKFDLLIALVLILGLTWFIFRHIKNR
jgi:membrane protein DedA with SNARE-associated domain